jgi:hypothetical protein
MINSKLELLKNARREAWIVLGAWAACLAWVVGYSYLRGYVHPPDSLLVRWGLALAPGEATLRLILGLPEWVFYGIFTPWLIAAAFTIFFGLRIMRDDDLGADREQASPPAEG